MFSIINEIKDNSPPRIVGVVSSSIGSAASIYVVVAITGYITFGNAIVGNIVSMCKFPIDSGIKTFQE
jgi:amino acid permease